MSGIYRQWNHERTAKLEQIQFQYVPCNPTNPIVLNTCFRVRAKLVAAGHEASDVERVRVLPMWNNQNNVRFNRRGNTSTPLSFRVGPYGLVTVWRLIKPRVEEIVLHEGRMRAFHKRKDLVASRLVTIRQVYLHYAATLPARSWLYLPPLRVMLQFAPLKDFMYSYSEEPPQLADLDDATSQFPDYIESWTLDQRVQIEQMFPNRLDCPDFPWSDAGNMLDLATTVFQCADCHLVPRSDFKKPAIAWAGILAHYHCCFGQWETSVPYSYFGSATVAALVRLLGLSPLTTLPNQLDELDHRFFCAGCPQTPTRKAYTWRECVRYSDLPT